jgi:hypothetical protein
MPCEVAVDPKYAYRIAGDGLVPSDSFLLPRGKDAVRLDAKMGSASGRFSGLVLMGLGAGGIALGGAGLVASPVLDSHDSGSAAFRTGVRDGAYVALGAGVIAVGVGLYLWLSNDTTVRDDDSYPAGEAGAARASRYGAESVSIALPVKGLALTPNGVTF